METYKKNTIISLAETLLQQITEVLDSEGTEIEGELRCKLGIAESNLYKISELLKNDK